MADHIERTLGREMAERRRASDAAAEGAFAMPRVIRTKRLVLAPMAAHQLGAYTNLFADPAARFLGGPLGRPGAYDRMARFSGAWRVYGFGAYTISDHDGRVLGYAGLWFPHDKPEIEVGYGLLPSARGEGVAAEAVRAVVDVAGAAGVPSLVSYVAPDNAASLKVAVAAGASREATLRFGEHDAHVMRYPVPGSTPEDDGEPLLESSVMPLFIRTERLALTQLRADHAPRFFDHVADEDTMSSMGGPMSVYEASRVFFADAGAWHLKGYGNYVVEHEGRFVGSVGLYHPAHWPEVELAFDITTDSRRQGFATEAAAAVRDVAAEQGRRRLVSYIHPENAASIAVARKLSAREEGRITLSGPESLVFAHAMPAEDTVPIRSSEHKPARLRQPTGDAPVAA